MVVCVTKKEEEKMSEQNIHIKYYPQLQNVGQQCNVLPLLWMTCWRLTLAILVRVPRKYVVLGELLMIDVDLVDDKNRVKLSRLNNDPLSTYINASFIQVNT